MTGRNEGPPSGVLLVDKPAGPTSHDVVDRARTALGTHRVGHTGTLDPFATGLLILCAGAATRLAEYFLTPEKRYEAVLRLGVETETHDPEGDVVSESAAWRDVSRGELERVLAEFTGRIRQVPPAFSAKSVAGERAHRAARSGRPVELEPAEVRVGALVLEAFEPPRARVTARVGSGTYVRALARDVGRALGCGAHLEALRRTAIGPHTVERAVDAGELTAERWRQAGESRRAWLGASAALPWLARRELAADEADRVRNGAHVPRGEVRPATAGDDDGSGPVLLIRDGRLLAVAEPGDERLYPRKVWPDGL